MAIRKNKCPRHRSWTNKVTKRGNKDLGIPERGLNEALHFLLGTHPSDGRYLSIPFPKRKTDGKVRFHCAGVTFLCGIGNKYLVNTRTLVFYLFGKRISLAVNYRFATVICGACREAYFGAKYITSSLYQKKI